MVKPHPPASLLPTSSHLPSRGIHSAHSLVSTTPELAWGGGGQRPTIPALKCARSGSTFWPQPWTSFVQSRLIFQARSASQEVEVPAALVL